MKFTTQDEPDLTLPEDTIFRAVLEEIKLHEFEWNDGGTMTKSQTLQWWWRITVSSAGPVYIGRKVKGECKPILSNRDGNRFRAWSEAVLNRKIPVGMDIDTDDLIGLSAEIVIGHKPDKKDPSKMWEFVSDVMPLDDQPGGTHTEPPF